MPQSGSHPVHRLAQPDCPGPGQQHYGGGYELAADRGDLEPGLRRASGAGLHISGTAANSGTTVPALTTIAPHRSSAERMRRSQPPKIIRICHRGRRWQELSVPGHLDRVCAVVYAPAEPALRAQLPEPPGGQSREETAREVFARAVEHGDAHVIKFADTAIDVFARTGNRDVIAAALRAAELIGP